MNTTLIGNLIERLAPAGPHIYARTREGGSPTSHALLTAFGSPYDSRLNGSASLTRSTPR